MVNQLELTVATLSRLFTQIKEFMRPLASIVAHAKRDVMGVNLAKAVGHVMVSAKRVQRNANYARKGTTGVNFANQVTLGHAKYAKTNATLPALVANPAKDANLVKGVKPATYLAYPVKDAIPV